MREGYNRPVASLGDLIRSAFSFLFARSSTDERLVAYVIREHERGRPLQDILQDPFILNRTTPEDRGRLLDRPEVVRALGHDVVESTRAIMQSR
jgi:hypothetical protein